MQVLITTDVELWPRRWDLSRAEMSRAFSKYILGNTAKGAVGLPFQLRLLGEHGLRGVFFIEPLFACVMGKSALEDIVGLVREAGQEIQLHLHTEWMGRSDCPDLRGPPRMSIKELDENAQTDVIGTGLVWLEEAGGGKVTTFRAGAYGADRATLRALRRLGLVMDSSHNPAGSRGPLDAALHDEPQHVEGILEVPQTVYRDAFGRVRHVQIGSSSAAEVRHTLAAANKQGRSTYVILSHSSELLTEDRERPDRIATRRFEALCRYLADHSDAYTTGGFNDLDAESVAGAGSGAGLAVGMLDTARRYGEQALRRIF